MVVLRQICGNQVMQYESASLYWLSSGNGLPATTHDHDMMTRPACNIQQMLLGAGQEDGTLLPTLSLEPRPGTVRQPWLTGCTMYSVGDYRRRCCTKNMQPSMLAWYGIVGMALFTKNMQLSMLAWYGIIWLAI